MKEARKVKLIHPANKGEHLVARSVGRNTPCKCGSGKKAKHCCGAETKYYSKKAPQYYGAENKEYSKN